MTQNAAPRKVKSVSYAKWGYIFLIPFFLTFPTALLKMNSKSTH